MTARPLEEILDEALLQQRQNGSSPDILAADTAEAEALQPLLETAMTLEMLLPVQMPEQSDLAQDRERFLSRLTALRPLATVPVPLVRLRGWLDRRLPKISFLPRQREQNRMSMLVLKATLVLIVAFASAGGTAALASQSLPDSPLYPLKLTIEESRFLLANDPAEQALLQLQFAEERVGEIEEMIRVGRTPGEESMVSLQEHFGQAFYLAAQTPDQDMAELLIRAREMAQTQEQAMNRAQADAVERVQSMLQQTAQLIVLVRETCDRGLLDPQGFRAEFTRRGQIRFGLDRDWLSNGPARGLGECTGFEDCDPAIYQHQYGPGDGDPGRHGLGPVDCAEIGDCDPAGAQHQYGLDAEDPGQHGSGPADCVETGDCDPAGDQHQYGPSDEDPGQHGLGPEECLAAEECDPAGDQHHYGEDGHMGTGSPGPGDNDSSGSGGEQNGPGPGQQEQHQGQNSEDTNESPSGSGGSGADDSGNPDHGNGGGGGQGGRGG